MAEATRRAGRRGRAPRYLVIVSILALLYVVSGRLGLLLAHYQQNATLIWPPTGLSLAALVLFGKRLWPGVFVGSVVTNAMIGTSPIAVIGIGAGNTLEAVVGATLLMRVAHFDSAFARLRDVIAFLIYGALLSTTVSATIGVGTLYLTGAITAKSMLTVWLIWWLGDAGGATVVAPLLLVGIEGRPPWSVMARRAETWGVFSLLLVLALFGFAGTSFGAASSLLPALLVFPVLVWVGLRLGPRGATLGSFVVGAVAVVGTAQGFGPFSRAGPSGSLFLVWAYVSAVGAVAMILAAAVAEREHAELERRRADEERAGLAVEIQHAQRLESLGLLAGGIAHDFNNLLVPIRGNAELLKLGVGDASQRDEMLDAIEVASVQAANLCRQLLIYAGRNRPAKQRLDLVAITREMLPLLRTSTPRTVDLQLAVDEEVPAIEGDRGQLTQVLMNLVINASEAITCGSGWVRVAITARDVDQAYLAQTFLHSDAPAGRYVVLEVSDNGAGMAADTIERIFDPFFSTKRTGRGLGMASVLGIVGAHEGAIKVRSQPGSGTIFEVLFPVASELGARTGASEPRAAQRRRPKATLLVADDEESVRKVTRRMLERAGFEVLEARDGAEAVELFVAHERDIDLVLFDVSMPRLSGTEALAKIHERRPELPAVLISGYDEGRVDKASGAVFMHKPVRMNALLDVVTQCLQPPT